MPEPQPYPNNTRVATLWRQMYIDCQEVIYAIRHLAIAGRVLGRDDLLDASRKWLLAVAAWDTKGATSRAYNDEAGFRVVVALAWGYDWLYDHLSEDERRTVRSVLLERTREVADHVIAHARIHVFPYDSHAVRSLSAVLTPACIALQGESDEAGEWLDYTVEFLATLYSPWAGTDGGWAEGPHYWMTGMAYLIEAANLIRSYIGYDLYQRPFFQNTGRFPLYTKAPGTRRANFGDDSTLGDLPGLKLGYNVRQFAGVTGNGHYQWYFDHIKADATGTEMAFTITAGGTSTSTISSIATITRRWKPCLPPTCRHSPFSMILVGRPSKKTWKTRTGTCSSSSNPALTVRSATVTATRMPLCFMPMARIWRSSPVITWRSIRRCI